MIQVLSTWQVVDALKEDKNANWSHYGAKALAEYLENLEEDQGLQAELDLVAINRDYTEYLTLHDWAKDRYGYKADLNKQFNWDEDTSDEDKDDDLRNFIDNNHTLIEFNGGIIVSNY
jgi:hypothetical protein